MALLSGLPRQADITALTYCRLLVLRKADFEQFMTANPEAREAINRTAASRHSMNQEDRDRETEAVSV
jgi:CRP-like cAMP-binding protein